MTPLERKAYNKQYYDNRKDVILTNLSKRIKCEKCSRVVAQSTMRLHQQRALCKKFSKIQFA